MMSFISLSWFIALASISSTMLNKVVLVSKYLCLVPDPKEKVISLSSLNMLATEFFVGVPYKIIHVELFVVLPSLSYLWGL